MATPYVILLTIQYPSGTNLNNVNATIRVESTNESKTKATDSSGEVSFNLGNSKDFPSGWQFGDVFSWVVIYQGFEAYGSHTITTGGGFKQTVVLTAVPTTPSLKIFTVQEFLDYFNFSIVEDDAENGVSSQQVVKIGRGVEQQLENETNNIFDDNGGNNYSKTEHIDTDKYSQVYHTSKLPITSVTALYTTQNDQEGVPDYPNNTSGWNTLTEGTDFVIDLDTGRIQITNSSYAPITRRWGLYIDYKYGRTTPDDVKILAIIETGLRMSGSVFIKNKVKKISDVEIGDLSSFDMYREKILKKYRVDGLTSINT